MSSPHRAEPFSEEDVRHLLAPRYAPLARIGAGACSVVWRVADREAQGAIKAVKLCALDSDTEREELAEEYLLAGRLRHPNLVRHEALHLFKEAALVVMEHVPGRPLGIEQGPLDGRTIAALFVELLRALELLHHFGYLHGDVKPANVLCDLDGASPRIKLLDYHLLYRPQEMEAHSSRGTLRYLAPEALCGERVDARADLYAAGVLLYELLAQQPLFTGTPAEVARAHRTGPVPHVVFDDPDKEALFALARRLLAKHPEGRYQSAAEAAREALAILGSTESVETPDTLLGRLASVALIGRTEALDAARELLEGGAQGQSPRLLCFEGRPGAGKSRLLAECARIAQTMGYRTISLACSRGKPDLAAVAAQAAGRGPVALLLDDADALSTDVLRALCAAPGVCIATCSATRVAGPFGSARETLVVPLADLDAQERRAMTAMALPRSAPEGLIGDIAACCGGAPRVLAQTIEHVLSFEYVRSGNGGRQYVATGPSTLLPEPLAQEFLRLHERASPPMRDLLELLALSPSGAALDVLAVALEMTPDALLELIAREAAGAVLSLQRCEGATRCGLQHGGLRERLLKGLPPERQRALHDRLAGAMGVENVEAACAVIRHRLLGAAPEGGVTQLLSALSDMPRSLPYDLAGQLVLQALPHARGDTRAALLERGAEAHNAVGDYATADRLCHEALAMEALSPSARRRMRRSLAISLAREQRGEEALALIEADRARSEAISPHEAMHDAMIFGEIARVQSRLEQGQGHYEEALRLAREAGDAAMEARALRMIGMSLLQRGIISQSSKPIAQSLRLCHRLGDSLGMARALSCYGYAAMFAGNVARAQRLFRRAAPALRAAGMLEEEARARTGLGTASQRAYDGDNAIARYSEALLLYRRLGNRKAEATLLGNLCQVYTTMGRLEEAMDHVRRGMEIPSDPRTAHRMWVDLGWAHYHLGDTSVARRTAQEVCESARRNALLTIIESAARLRARTALLEGRLAEGETHMREALAVSVEMRSPTRQSVCLARLAEVLLEMGRLPEAEGLVRESCNLARHSGSRAFVTLAEMMAGATALATGDCDRARPLLLRAYNDSVATRDWAEIVRIALLLGGLFERTGQLRFAGFYYRSAVDQIEGVLAHLRDPRNRELFMNDPRRAAVVESVGRYRRLVAARASSHERMQA